MGKLFCALALSVLVAPAWADELTLTLAGDFYEGGPAYAILADNQPVSTGVVTDPAGQTVTVEVGDPQSLAIQFTNDAAGPAGPDGRRPPGTDRNLVVQSVQFRGKTILGRDLPRVPGTSLRGQFMVVASNGSVAIPLETAAEPPAAAAATPATSGPSPTTAAVAQPQCDAKAELSGYSNGAVVLSQGQRAQLAPIVASSGCAVTITGYTSTAGDEELNQRVALDRAQAVLKYLDAQGAKFTDTQVVGHGETTQFGPTLEDNRKVVVQLR